MSLLTALTPLKGAAGPFNPIQLPSLSVWLDGATPSNFALSGSNITNWINKGSSSDFGLQSVSPVFATNVQNGLGAALFDNTSTLQMLGNNTNPLIDVSVGFFASFVVKFTTEINVPLFFAVNTNSGSNQYAGFAVSSNPAYNDIMFNAFDGSNGYPNMRASTPNGTTIDIIGKTVQISFAYDGSGYTGSNTAGFKIWLNGNPLTVTNTASSVGPQNGVNTIGGWGSNGNRPNGYIGEVILVSTNLSSTLQNQTMAYMQARWNL